MYSKSSKKNLSARQDLGALYTAIAINNQSVRLQQKAKEAQSADRDLEKLNMESVVKTLQRMGHNPTELLVKNMGKLNPQQQAKVNMSLAEMGQRELVAEKKEIKHEGLGLLDVLEAQARAQMSDEDKD